MTQLRYNNIFDAITDDKSEAADLSFRADLIVTLRNIFEANQWNQAAIAGALEIPQPRVSELLRGKVHLFSADKLIGYLAKLGVRLRPSFSADHEVVCEVVTAA
ncbi:helix-turn-helix domain-containing protein [Hoeflea ulvae]|uniref:XRE family transcriptional regulator n=1 Tax=Hoeflea ulvae TaxID=2983764 RepID=A0ABT3YB64_9HYPH|nr:XRE family transcriptional regulator [Hoeflea ulvae]MCY0093123.1 XRE family transcriptional regulator [Hoeflea ulvae]